MLHLFLFGVNGLMKSTYIICVVDLRFFELLVEETHRILKTQNSFFRKVVTDLLSTLPSCIKLKLFGFIICASHKIEYSK